MITRRTLLAAFAQAPTKVIDTHIHLFAADRKAFPYHKNATYQPPAEDLEPYKKFVAESGLAGAVLVHPEPYQDDHRYLEYCFRNEPKTDFFRGTVLLDPLNPNTLARVEALRAKWPGRIVALRLHRVTDPAQGPTMTGAIRERDLESPSVLRLAEGAARMRLGLQVHAIPAYAPQISELAAAATGSTVVIDHLCRGGMGSPDQWPAVLRLASRPNVVMKISGIPYSSKEAWPHRDAIPRVRELYEAFGPDRLIWGGVGYKMADYRRSLEQFELFFAYAHESARNLIRGGNAARLWYT